TQAGVLKGKFGYMAPEMVRYERIDARADLFCAGVVMYLMMAGRHPVAGAAVMEAIQRFEQKQIPPPSQFNSSITPALDTIVMRALEPQPDQRWGSAAALGDALRDVLLQNPKWRKHAKGGGQRLAELIRRVAPDEFEPPVSSDLLQRLLADAESDATRPPTPFPPAISEPFPVDPNMPTDGGMPVVSPEPASGPQKSPDVETDEQLQVREVLSAKEQLYRERGASAVADLLEEADSSAQTAANPVVDRSMHIGFPQSSDRNRKDSDILAEPALPADQEDGARPASPANGASTSSLLDGQTESGYAYDEQPIDRPLRLDTERDDQTVVSPPTVGDFDADAQTKAVSDEFESQDAPVRRDDSKTVAGAFVPPEDDIVHREGPRPQIIDSAVHGAVMTSQEDDPSTVVPLYGPGGVTDRQEPMSALMPSFDQAEARPSSFGPGRSNPQEIESVGDATLLDGIDVREVKKALAAVRAESEPELLEVTQAVQGDPSLDAVTEESRPREVRSGIFQRPPASTSPAEKTVAGSSVDALLSPPLRASSVRADSNAPIRVLLGADGEVSRLEEDDSATVAATQTHAPAVDITASKLMNPPVHNPVPPVANGIPRLSDAKAGMGANTGRWMAGEIDGNALAWDDEAAARRAVATRDKVSRAQPPPTAPRSNPATNGGPIRNSPVLLNPLYERPGFWARNGMLLGTMLVAFALLAGLVYAILFTQVFWPRLKLSSEPAGAAVLVDGVQAPGRTPLVVQVEPERRHRIEFRLDGYQRTLREITEGIGRAKTYTLTVQMARVPPTVFLPVSGRVSVNDRIVGEGRKVQLTNVDRTTGKVRLRVVADGYEPYEVRFRSAKEIPSSLDVPLRKKSKK
ncbi:MAG: PEGA domain-containing protein, partial [Myxococcota bacterium]